GRDHSSPRHGREERDLAGTGDRRVWTCVSAIDGGPDDLRILERMGIFLAALPEPSHQLRDGHNGFWRRQFFLGLADAFAHPGEIDNLQRSSSIKWVKPARR